MLVGGWKRREETSNPAVYGRNIGERLHVPLVSEARRGEEDQLNRSHLPLELHL